MVSCKISLQSQMYVTASASQLAVDSIAAGTYSSVQQKKPRTIRIQQAFYVKFNN